MKIFEIAKFFGFPSQNEDFDKFLSANHIVKRPIFKENPIEVITVEKEGIGLLFEMADYYRETYGPGPVNENGDMVLATIQVNSDYYAGKPFRYADNLPFGLKFENSLTEAIAILGEPRNSHRSGPVNHTYNWNNFQGYQISLNFLPEGKKIAWLSLSPQEIYLNN
ncbi:hypothetical protein [Massilia genomosp. 1]|uniref:Uncharacterized protein n=1 Tax=Massilia genomosp. 1 TaxID=2609280 RepID=A0ABX0N1X5_9BURK|nr:hypothetical protein [Massilia genomosp. 1]NHZ65887.1 hypothetical protein [Massilia genomosp. 1]